MKTQKDNRIELFRFIFAIVIMIFHAHNINNGHGHPIPLGHVFVEFFFFLTGYFTYSSLMKNINGAVDMSVYPFQYTWRKFERFFPYLFMTAVLYVGISVIYILLVKHQSVRDVILQFSGLPFDVLLLQVTGICKNPNFNAWWYLSAILFTMPLVVVVFYRKHVLGGCYTYIVYFVPLLIYGAFSVQIKGLDWDREVFGVIKSGLFRGFAGLCVGCIIYDLKERLSSIKTDGFKKVIFTIIEIGSYVLSVVIAWRYDKVNNSTFLIVLLLIIALIITFSNKSYTIKLNKKIFAFFGMISLPLYICHYSIGRLIRTIVCFDNIYERYLLYFISSVISAIFMLRINKRFQKEQ